MAPEHLSNDQLRLLRQMQREGNLSPEDAARLKAYDAPDQANAPLLRRGRGDPLAGMRPLGQIAIEEGLPVATGLAGATLGTAWGGPWGGALLGAGGAMAGRAQAPNVAEYFGYTPSQERAETFLGDLKPIALEGLFSLGGEVAARGLHPLLTGAGRRMTLTTPSLATHPAAAARVRALDAVDAQPTLADVLGSGNIARREDALSVTPGGAPIIQRAREQRSLAVTGSADRLVNRLGPQATDVQRGTAARGAIEATLANMETVEQKAWTQLEHRVGSQAPIPTTHLQDRARELLRKELQYNAADQDPKFKALLEDILTEPSAIPYETMRTRISGWGAEAGRPLLTRSPRAAQYADLYGAALDDVKGGVGQIDPAARGLYERASTLTRDKHDLIRDMQINKLRDMDPEQVAKLAEGGLSTSELTRLRTALLGADPQAPTPGGQEAWDQIRRAIIEKRLGPTQGGGARITQPGTEVGTFNVATLKQKIAGITGIDVLLQPHEREALGNIVAAVEVMAKAAGPGRSVNSATAGRFSFGAGGGRGIARKAVGGAVGGGLGYVFGGGPMAAVGTLAGGLAGDAADYFVQRAAARILTDPRVARQLANPKMTRWIAEWSETGHVPRELARVIGNIGVRVVGHAGEITSRPSRGGASASW